MSSSSERSERFVKVLSHYRANGDPLTPELLAAREELRLLIRNSTVVPEDRFWAAAFGADPARAVVLRQAFILMESLGSTLSEQIGLIRPSVQDEPNFVNRLPHSSASASEKLLQLMYLADIDWIALAVMNLLVRDRHNDQSFQELIERFAAIGIDVNLIN